MAKSSSFVYLVLPLQLLIVVLMIVLAGDILSSELKDFCDSSLTTVPGGMLKTNLIIFNRKAMLKLLLLEHKAFVLYEPC